MEEDYDLRRGGRVAEGARLESVYRVYSSIEGSNPSPSATITVDWVLRTAVQKTDLEIFVF